jgi:integrase
MPPDRAHRAPRSAAQADFWNPTGLGENWTPRELRHSFVSLVSDNGVPLETIADLVGHASTAVTEEVYRHQLKPVITRGAETMNTIFTQNDANSA